MRWSNARWSARVSGPLRAAVLLTGGSEPSATERLLDEVSALADDEAERMLTALRLVMGPPGGPGRRGDEP